MMTIEERIQNAFEIISEWNESQIPQKLVHGLYILYEVEVPKTYHNELKKILAANTQLQDENLKNFVYNKPLIDEGAWWFDPANWKN